MESCCKYKTLWETAPSEVISHYNNKRLQAWSILFKHLKAHNNLCNKCVFPSLCSCNCEYQLSPNFNRFVIWCISWDTFIQSMRSIGWWPSKHVGPPLLYVALPDAVQSPGTRCPHRWFVVIVSWDTPSETTGPNCIEQLKHKKQNCDYQETVTSQTSISKMYNLWLVSFSYLVSRNLLSNILCF